MAFFSPFFGLCLAGAFFGSAQAQSVFLPNLWNPDHQLQKPDLVGIHSLRFLTDDDYPPFNFLAANGALVGFNVDLARAICEELKVTCTIQARRWDTLVPSLDEGLGDAVIASFAINAESRDKLDFTRPYFKMPARFAVRSHSSLSDFSPEGLSGKTVGVEAHSAHEAYLRTFFPSATIKSYDSQMEVRTALANGDIDALFGDGISLSLWLNAKDSGDCCVFRGGAYTESKFFGEGAGIAVKKDNSALRHALDYALAALAQKGLYADLYLKYFPIGIY